MSYEISGTVLEIYPEQQFPSGFSKREFVITTQDRYPQCVKLEFFKEKCAQLDKFQPGDPVRVAFNIRGSEYNGRYYVNLQAWKIDPDGGSSAQPSSYPSQPPQGNRMYAPNGATAVRPAPAVQQAIAAPTHGQGRFHEDEDDEVPF